MSADPPASDGTERRTQPETFRARTISASLTVADIQASLDWYRDVVGFIVDEEYERDGELAAVALKAGHAWILISQDDGARGRDRPKDRGFSLHFTTAQDVDELAARIRERGGTLEAEPADTTWGARLFRLEDPDGFRLSISSIPLPS